MVATSKPLSRNAFPPSGPNTTPSSQLAKLGVAHQAVLVQDSQRLLDMTYQDNQQHRAQTRRLREAQMANLSPTGNVATAQPTDDPMGDINIDSPTNHYHPASSGGWKLPATVAAALLALVGVAVATKGLPPATPTTGASAAKPEATPGTPQKYDAVYEEQQADGTWKEVKREHLKP